MTTAAKLRQGTPAWFDMVGERLGAAAARAGLPAGFNLSLVETYTDGAALPGGLVQGIRIDILGGKLAFRTGVRPGEQADLSNVLTVAAARELNLLYSADPAFEAAQARLLASGAMRLEGDFTRLGDWFFAVHDAIVDRTC